MKKMLFGKKNKKLKIMITPEKTRLIKKLKKHCAKNPIILEILQKMDDLKKSEV